MVFVAWHGKLNQHFFQDGTINVLIAYFRSRLNKLALHWR
jgi:hypothetical protein